MNPPHILIVDDEPNIVMSLEFLMRKNGYRVGIARNGTEALAAIEQAPFDLVAIHLGGLGRREIVRDDDARLGEMAEVHVLIASL